MSCLTALLLIATPALADVGALDAALSPWLDARPSIGLAARMELTAWQPFPEETLELINRVLKHVTLEARLDRASGATQLALRVSEETMLELRERVSAEGSALTSSPLPNRTLTLASGPPLDALAGQGETDDAPFALLTAIAEAGEAYPALIEAIAPYAEEKKANYKIKGVGTCRFSRLAKLTEEQSGGMLAQLRAVLMAGMDAAGREALSQVTFEKGLTVGLYQNADKEDMAVYMKGTLVCPDGSTRKLSYQWAFAEKDGKRTDAYKYEATGGKPADNRVIAATLTRQTSASKFDLQGKTETKLKAEGETATYTVETDLSGKAGDTAACAGTVSRAVKRTVDDETVTDTQTLALDLRLTDSLTGTAEYERKRDKAVQTGLTLVFGDGSTDAGEQASDSFAVNDDGNAPSIVIHPAEGAEEAPAARAPALDYQGGAAPLGMTRHDAPNDETAVALDSLTQAQRDALLDEMAQNLAAKLLVAIAALPEEDAALLRDGMRDTDYAAFLSLLDNR